MCFMGTETVADRRNSHKSILIGPITMHPKVTGVVIYCMSFAILSGATRPVPGNAPSLPISGSRIIRVSLNLNYKARWAVCRAVTPFYWPMAFTI